MRDDAPSPAKLALSALVLAASDAALLAIAVSPFARDAAGAASARPRPGSRLAPPDVPADLSLPALARGALEHVREQASSLRLGLRRP